MPRAERLSPRVRHLLGGGAALLLVIAAYASYARYVSPQEPRTFYDSGTFFQIAERPISPALFALAKPPTVPLVFRIADRNAEAIAAIQVPLCFACWLALGVSVVLALRRPAARVGGALVVFGMLLAPARLGWTAVSLSESVTDSLFALLVACLLGLAAIPRAAATAWARAGRVAFTGGALLAGVAWIFARDTDALAAVAAVPCAVAIWWPALRTAPLRPGAIMLAAAALLAGTLDVCSARVEPAAPLGFQDGWAPVLTARTGFPAVNNLLLRVLPDPDGRAFFVEHGLPIAQVEPFEHPPRRDDFVRADPARAEAQVWVAEHGTATLLSWLARDPIARLRELASDRATLLAPDVRSYMPPGWRATDPGLPVVDLPRRALAHWITLALLAAVAPFALRRPRADPRAGLAACLIATGLLATIASYYGDALEPARHCYGAAQHVLLGLAIAALAFADRLLANRRDPARDLEQRQ